MNGTHLTLGLVGALAAAGALSRRGSRAPAHGGRGRREGAGVLLTTGQRVLVLLRSGEVNDPNTWSVVGGEVEPGEDPLVAGLRELEEETGIEIEPNDARVIGSTVRHQPDSSSRYTTFVVRVPQSMSKRRMDLNRENDEAQWWTAEDVVNHLDDLHPGLRAVLPKILDIAFDGSLPAVLGPIEVPRRPADAPRAPETPAFRRWFRDSAVVWADGTPRAVYHSGPRTDFEVFDRLLRAEHREGLKIDTIGNWFATRSGPLYGPSVRGYWLSIQNPKVFAGPAAWKRMYREAEAMARKPGSAWAKVYEDQQRKGGFPAYKREELLRGVEQLKALPKSTLTSLAKAYKVDLGNLNPYRALWTAIAKDAVEDYRDALRNQGYDGILVTGDNFDQNDVDAWIAFDPNQIKSLDNAGTFDPRDLRVSMNRRLP
jgi:8-oxo-dGTP pyrophosphatase MutT (NUDIX family)